MGIETALIATSIAATAGSAYMGATAQQQQYQAQAQSAEYSAEVARNNAKIAEDNKQDIELQGRQAVFDQRRQVARSLSSVRAATAGSGLVVDEAGTTPQDLVQTMTEAGELDVMRLRNNIEREKRRAEIQGTNFQAQAGQLELEASNLESAAGSINPFFSAVLGGVGRASSPQAMDILFGQIGG